MYRLSQFSQKTTQSQAMQTTIRKIMNTERGGRANTGKQKEVKRPEKDPKNNMSPDPNKE